MLCFPPRRFALVLPERSFKRSTAGFRFRRRPATSDLPPPGTFRMIFSPRASRGPRDAFARTQAKVSRLAAPSDAHSEMCFQYLETNATQEISRRSRRLYSVHRHGKWHAARVSREAGDVAQSRRHRRSIQECTDQPCNGVLRYSFRLCKHRQRCALRTNMSPPYFSSSQVQPRRGYPKTEVSEAPFRSLDPAQRSNARFRERSLPFPDRRSKVLARRSLPSEKDASQAPDATLTGGKQNRGFKGTVLFVRSLSTPLLFYPSIQ